MEVVVEVVGIPREFPGRETIISDLMMEYISTTSLKTSFRVSALLERLDECSMTDEQSEKQRKIIVDIIKKVDSALGDLAAVMPKERQFFLLSEEMNCFHCKTSLSLITKAKEGRKVTVFT